MSEKRYKRIVDNKMRWQGDTDIDEKVIRVNKAKSKKKSSIIDTIVHEELHAKHPRMYEKTVRKKTKEWLDRATNEMKKKYYSLYQK